MQSLLALLLLALGAGSEPNVVIIMTDDQGWGDFGFHGNPVLETPALDQLASESARLSTFYVHPVCTPTRSALMTGRYPQRTRAFDTWVGRAMMDPEEWTMAEIFRDAGWATGIFGKWHLGDCYPMRAMDQGFEESLLHRGGGIGQPADPEGGEGKYTDPVLLHNGERFEAKGYCTDVYFDAGIEWMRKQHAIDRPFLMYLPTNAPHGPFHDVPEELYQKYKSKEFTSAFVDPEHGHPLPKEFNHDRLARIFAMIENVDQNVAKLDAALKELGIFDNTIVIYMNDNGPNSRRAVGGRRGMKASVYEGGVRSPLWVRWPNKLKAADVNGAIGANIDVLPTIVEACGIELEEDPAWDGRSLWPALAKTSAKVELQPRKHPLVIQAHRGDVGVRYHHFLLRTDRWKLVNHSGFGREVETVDPEFELYDMHADPLELKNVASEQPQVVAELKSKYDRWFDDVSTTRTDNWTPPPIVLGSEASREVHLTRQDWRKLHGAGWSKNSQGQWLVDVTHPGPYSIRVRFLDKAKVNQVDLHIGKTHRKKSVPAGAKEITVHGVMLPTGKDWLRIDCAIPGENIGPYQVIIHHVDPELGKSGNSGPAWVIEDGRFQMARIQGDVDGMFASAFRMLNLAILNSGSGSRDYAYSLNRVGAYFNRTDRREKTAKTVAYTSALYHRVLGTNHCEALMYQAYRLELNNAEPRKVLPYYLKAYQISPFAEAPEGDAMFMATLSAARIYQDLGEHKRALHYLDLADNAIKKYSSMVEIDRNAYLNVLATHHFRNGENDQTIEICKEILKYEERLGLDRSPYIADSHFVLAFLYQNTNELDFAKKHVEEALRIYQLNFKEENRDIVRSAELLQEINDILEERSF